MATIEALPLLAIFIMLVGYSLGLWGSIHTSILHSIAARQYAFETFRNRADLTYHRWNSESNSHMASFGIRWHGITDEAGEVGVHRATARPLAIGREPAEEKGKPEDHNVKIYQIEGRNREGGVEVNPIWVMIGYGMCLNMKCGGDLR